MFQMSDDTSYKWPVTVHKPVDGGKFVKSTFTAEFKAMPQDEIDSVLENAGDNKKDADLCSTCLIGWSAVQAADKSELPYSDEAKAKLINIPYVRTALVTAFFDSLNGGAARRKN